MNLNNSSTPRKWWDILRFSFFGSVVELVEPIASIVDTSLVGHLSTRELAALGAMVIVFSSSTWIFSFLLHTTVSPIAKAVSEKDHQTVQARFQTSLIFALGISVIGVLILGLGRNLIFQIVGVSAEIEHLCQDYFSIRLFGVPAMMMLMTLGGTFRGFEQLRATIIVNVVVSIVNILVSYGSIEIWNFGLPGVAFGTVLSFYVGVVAYLFYLKKLKLSEKYHLFKLGKIERGEWSVFRKDSSSIFLRSSFLTGSFFASTAVAARISTTALASHQIILELWLFMAYLLDGPALTASVYGAQYQTGSREQSAFFKQMIRFGVVLGFFLFLVHWFGSRFLTGVFTNDPVVYEQTQETLRILGLSYFFNSLAFIGDGFLFARLDYRYAGRMMAISVLFGVVPCFWFALDQGDITYIWLGMALTNLLRSLLCLWRVRRKS